MNPILAQKAGSDIGDNEPIQGRTLQYSVAYNTIHEQNTLAKHGEC